ncbi:GIN domain-containing protein [Parasphingorhabdus sp.]|uniref:GIN domain-containing protein n=1 Tax=Parasphingorhabdus sp. TaxID=2709688 RepID=UPI002F93D511
MKKPFAGLICVLAGCLTIMHSVQVAQAAERKFSISSFEDVRIIGNINVSISTDRGVSASAEAANREVLDRVLLRKNGSQLIVSVQPKTSNDSHFSGDEPVTVTLSSPVVKSITHSGSGAVALDKLGGRDARARLSGFGVLTIGDVDSDTLNIAMTGGGQIIIAGQAKKGRIELLGSSVLDGSGLRLQTLDLVQRGPASSHVFVEKEVTISNNGTGKIQIDGRPNCSVRSGTTAQIICDPKR